MSDSVTVTDHVFSAIRACCDAGVTAGLEECTPIRRLRLDSLKMVQIVYELECSMGVELQEHLLFQLETVGDLVALAREARGAAA